jgi:hypothetical protein
MVEWYNMEYGLWYNLRDAIYCMVSGAISARV